MSAAAAQLRFAADFAVFLVAGAGVTLLVIRPSLLVTGTRVRPVVAIGFGILAVAALFSGLSTGATPLVGDRSDEVIATVLPLAAVALLSVAPTRWPGAALGRVGYVAGLVATVAAELLGTIDVPVGADWLRLVGATGLGIGIFLAARRSIPTRIATSASAVLLAVVLAVSVGLSAVLADNVEDEAVRRLGASGGTEAQLVEDAGVTAQQNASIAAQGLGGSAALGDRILRLTGDPSTAGADDAQALAEALQRLLDRSLRGIDPQVGPLLLVGADGRRLVAVTPQGVTADEPLFAAMEGSDVVAEAITNQVVTQSVILAGPGAMGLSAAPIEVRSAGGTVRPAVVIVSSLLDDRYLQTRLERGADAELEGRGIVLASRSDVLATAGAVVPTADVLAAAAEALAGAPSSTRTAGALLVAARPVFAADGVPVLAVVVGTPTAQVQEVREDLFRLLFLIAIGGTALALVLTALVGEQIGTGLRSLTTAAGEVTSGNLLAASGVRSDDELGVLSSAFDSMTVSLRRMNADLRTAAEDETRLRARMEAVVGGMGEALVAVDANGDVTDFNAAAELLTGVPDRKALGRPVAQILRLALDDVGEVAVDVPVEEPWSKPGMVHHTSGVEVPVVVSAGPLRGAQNQLAGSVYLLRDVRREREVERIKSELLSNISHELRTPLSPIKAYSQILRSRKLPEEDVRRFANEIEKSSARLERVVVQLVNFASMTAGRYEVHREVLVVRDVIDRVVQRWTDRLDGDVHPVRRRVGRGVGKALLDRQAVEQALDELLDNAVKYSPDGGRIDVTATAEQHPEKGAVLRITVADRGVGIPADRLGDVLDDFTQGDGSATRSFGGLGLGLTLVNRIARAHSGEVEVDSTEGKGTKVSILVPLDDAVRVHR